MLSLPKHRFVIVGLLEALGAVFGMAAGAMLPGASIPFLSQSFLVWQLLLSIFLINQICGCLLVTVGVIRTVASGSGAGQTLKEAGFFWALLMITSFFFQAADTVLKGHSVDLFVVNSYGSAFQALFICLLLPFLSKLWGVVPFGQLAGYLRDGASCFLNMGSSLSTGCEGAPLLLLLSVSVNMAFNISLLHLFMISSALSRVNFLSSYLRLRLHSSVTIPWSAFDISSCFHNRSRHPLDQIVYVCMETFYWIFI